MAPSSGRIYISRGEPVRLKWSDFQHLVGKQSLHWHDMAVNAPYIHHQFQRLLFFFLLTSDARATAVRVAWLYTVIWMEGGQLGSSPTHGLYSGHTHTHQGDRPEWQTHISPGCTILPERNKILFLFSPIKKIHCKQKSKCQTILTLVCPEMTCTWRLKTDLSFFSFLFKQSMDWPLMKDHEALERVLDFFLSFSDLSFNCLSFRSALLV